MRPRCLYIVAASLFTLCAGAAQASYIFQNIVDPLNPTFTQALGINNAGNVVGYGNATVFNGFLAIAPYGAANFTRQNFPGADGGTQVVGISGAGRTVGFSITGGVTNGFAQNGGVFTTVDAPGTAFNQLLGINNVGTTAAGYSSTDPAGNTLQRALTVALASSVFTDINALLPANFNSQATGVNNSGTVVGFYQNAGGNFSAFVDASGMISTISIPGATSAQALGINDLGAIVGDYVDAGGFMHGFVDNAGLLTTLDPLGSIGTTANGINDHGQVVGFYMNANEDTVGFLAQQQVPEPASVSLVCIGLLGLAAVRRRQLVRLL